jgi:tetratricopeptide (TPR) repeat protein
MPEPASAPASVPELRGHCTPPVLSEILRDLYLNERSGTLVISRSGVSKRVVLDRGMIAAATSSLEDERLAVFMVQRGLLPPAAADVLKGVEDRRVAETLLSRGAVSAEALSGAVRELAQQILTGVFRWEELEYRFLDVEAAAWPVPTNVVISFELIIRALRSMAGFDDIKQAIVRQERAVRLADDLYLPFDQLALMPNEGFLLSRIDGHTRPRDILALLPPAEEEPAARFLFGMLILNLAQFHPPIGVGMLTCALLLRGDEEKRRREENERDEIRAFYQACCTGDAASTLGVSEGASPDDIRKAYEQRKERYDIARYLRRVQVDLREELQIIEARLLEAFLALRAKALSVRHAPGADEAAAESAVNVMRKELTKTEKQSDADNRRQLSDQYFTRAREYWKMGDMYNCIRYCEFALSHHDGDAALQSLLGQALARNPDHRWQRRAEAALVRATELEPFNPQHFVQLGDFYRSHNMLSKARKQFEKALQILPSHVEAQQALKSLPVGKR